MRKSTPDKDIIKKLNARIRKLNKIRKLGELSLSIKEPDKLLISILDLIVEQVKSEAGSILLVQRRTGELMFRVARDSAGLLLVREEAATKDSIACWVAAHGKPVIVNDPDDDTRFEKKIGQSCGLDTKNMICLPLIIENRVIGVIEVINKKNGRRFTDKDIKGLKLLMANMATALDNILIYEDMKRRNDEAITLYEISRAFAETLNIEDILKSAMDILQKTMGIARCAVFLSDEKDCHRYPSYAINEEICDEEKKEELFRMAASRNIDAGDFSQISAGLGQSARKYLADEKAQDFTPFFLNEQGKSESFFMEPLVIGTRFYGLFIATRPRGYNFFPESDDYKTLYIIASLISQNLYMHETISNLDFVKSFNEDIFQSLNEGIITVLEGGKVISLNERGADLLGIDLKKGINLDFRDIFPSEIARPLIHGIKMLKSFSFEEKCNINGNSIILDISGNVMATKSLNEKAFTVSFRDITQLRIIQEKAHRAEKLAALSEMAAGVAHEIRNPLQSIRGFAQLLQQDTEGGREFLPIILSEVDRLNDIVGGFLSFARPIKPQLSVIQINEILQLIYLSLRRAYPEHKLKLECKMPVYAHGDKAQLRQVLYNIAMNGLQAMDPEKEGIMTIGCEFKDNRAVIIIADQGCGISPQNLSRLFNPFYTTKSNGTGLGLAISHRIIKEHGGDIMVESQLGEGTVFRIFLPSQEVNEN